jgi:hypothetical protein
MEVLPRRRNVHCGADHTPAVKAIVKARVDELCRRYDAGEPLFRKGEVFSVREALIAVGRSAESPVGLN